MVSERAKPLLIYVASPYGLDPTKHAGRRAEIQALGRRLLAVDAERAIWYMPIAMLTAWTPPELGTPLSTWPGQEAGWMAHANALWRVEQEGHEESPGMARETAMARERGIPVLNIRPEANGAAIEATLGKTERELSGYGERLREESSNRKR